MNEMIGINIKVHREQKAWTQDHLAEAASLATRTVQRAEGGLGMTAETLTAISGALDVDVDVLRFDPFGVLAVAIGVPREELTPALVESKRAELEAKAKADEEEFLRTHHKITVERVTRPDSFHHLRECHGSHHHVADGVSEDAKDVAAELQDFVLDYIDVAKDMSATGQRDSEKACFGIVKRLEALGCAVTVGSHEHTFKGPDGGKSMTWTVAYMVVCAAKDVRSFVAVKKGNRWSLG
jgi:transcriptional regulator with XRE-family HTH domain